MTKSSYRKPLVVLGFFGVFCSFLVFADGADHSNTKSDELVDEAVNIMFTTEEVTAYMRHQYGEDFEPSEQQKSEFASILLQMTVFSQAAAISGLVEEQQAEQPLNTDETKDEHARLLLKIRQMMSRSSLYEQRLREKYVPTTAHLKELYQEKMLALVEGMPNSSVPSFESARQILLESYIISQIDKHYESLLTGIVIAGKSTPQSTRATNDMHTMHDMSDMHAMHNMAVIGETLTQRLAYMTAHFEAGVVLLQSGDIKSAIGHLSHPVSEMHSDEWKGLDEFGFDQDMFIEIVYRASIQGESPELMSLIQKGQQNLYQVATEAGSNSSEMFDFIMDVAFGEYPKAVSNNTIIDQKIFQDLEGYLIVANYWSDKLPKSEQMAANQQLVHFHHMLGQISH